MGGNVATGDREGVAVTSVAGSEVVVLTAACVVRSSDGDARESREKGKCVDGNHCYKVCVMWWWGDVYRLSAIVAASKRVSGWSSNGTGASRGDLENARESEREDWEGIKPCRESREREGECEVEKV